MIYNITKWILWNTLHQHDQPNTNIQNILILIQNMHMFWSSYHLNSQQRSGYWYWLLKILSYPCSCSLVCSLKELCCSQRTMYLGDITNPSLLLAGLGSSHGLSSTSLQGYGCSVQMLPRQHYTQSVEHKWPEICGSGDTGDPNRKRLWQCEHCGKTFTGLQNKRFHVEAVHGNASYSCVCGKSYRYPRNLSRHQKECSVFLQSGNISWENHMESGGDMNMHILLLASRQYHGYWLFKAELNPTISMVIGPKTTFTCRLELVYFCPSAPHPGRRWIGLDKCWSTIS